MVIETSSETSSTSIRFNGALTVPEAYQAISLAQPLGNKIASWVVRLLFLGAFLFMSWVTVTSYLDGDRNLARMSLAVALFFLLTSSAAIGHSLWDRHRAYQLWKNGQGMYAPTAGEIDEHSFRSRSAEGVGSLNWSAFSSYRHSGNLAVLFREPSAGYVIIARSKFENQQDWLLFLDLASQKLEEV